jgi:hypothetical protein
MLTQRQVNKLLKCEEKIAKAMLTSYYEVGQQLAVIKDGDLYTDQYATFAEYCKERWSFSPDYGKKLIRAAAAVKYLLENRQDNTRVSSYLALPSTEAEARPLTKLDPEDIPAVWEKVIDEAAVDDHGNPVIIADDVETTVEWWLTPEDERPDDSVADIEDEEEDEGEVEEGEEEGEEEADDEPTEDVDSSPMTAFRLGIFAYAKKPETTPAAVAAILRGWADELDEQTT